MVKNTLPPLTSSPEPLVEAVPLYLPLRPKILSLSNLLPSVRWQVLAAAVFLVSVPVFFEAPLVRQFPLASLAIAGGWLGLSWRLLGSKTTQLWGDLLLGFAWTWLAGSIYWGWFRWEPTIHLPIEAIGVPFAIWCLRRQWGLVGNLFYLGSLLGTAATDLYFYLTGLIPYWRQLMLSDPALAPEILHQCLDRIQTGWGIGCAVAIASILLCIGLASGRSSQLHWRAFGGAVLSTILVDGLFWLAALFA